MLRIVTVACVLLTTAGLASAKRPPPPPSPMISVAPGGAPALTELVLRRSNQLAACSTGRAATVTIRATFARDGRARMVSVRSRGGRLFDRCVTLALRDQYATTRTSARVQRVKVEFAGAPPIDPASLQACTIDADCKLRFRSQGCIPSDPVAVTQADPAVLDRAFPVKREACAMGGPQYEHLRLSNVGRYQATCVQAQCAVIDHGPQGKLPL